MHLTPEEQHILDGGEGRCLQKAARALVDYGRAMSADALVPVRSVHLVISGGTVVLPGLFRILRDLAAEGHQVRVPTTLNPRPFEPGAACLSDRIAFARQAELEKLMAVLGCQPLYSCTPYLNGNCPSQGQLVAWAESSAVCYANSVLGARTNPTPGLIDLCCALLGKTPRFGLLLEQNRLAGCLIEVRAKPPLDFALLGYVVGRLAAGRIPLLVGLEATPDDLKNLGAAAEIAGGAGLLHVAGLTPEAAALGDQVLAADYERLTVTDHDLAAARDSLRGTGDQRPTQVVFGCPHLSLGEVEAIAPRFGGRPVKVPTWVLCCEQVRQALKDTEAERLLAASSAQVRSLCPLFYHDAPHLLAPRMMTPSVKLARHSAYRLYRPLDECMATALGES